jgi:hypothetical protein
VCVREKRAWRGGRAYVNSILTNAIVDSVSELVVGIKVYKVEGTKSVCK